MSNQLKYLSAYPQAIQDKVSAMLGQDKLAAFLLNKYPKTHGINNDKELREFTLGLKNRYLKKSDPLSKICFDNKIHVINNALGLHSYVSKVHGRKITSKNEIRISALFKNVPEAFLRMIVVHELAHLKEKEHNKAFYKLCQHMLADYHQLEFELRLYLTQKEFKHDIY